LPRVGARKEGKPLISGRGRKKVLLGPRVGGRRENDSPFNIPKKEWERLIGEKNEVPFTKKNKFKRQTCCQKKWRWRSIEPKRRREGGGSPIVEKKR